MIQLPATQGIFSKIYKYKVYLSQFLLLYKDFYSFSISINIFYLLYFHVCLIFMLKLKYTEIIFIFYHVSFTVLFVCILLCNLSVCGFPVIFVCQHFNIFDFTSVSHSWHRAPDHTNSPVEMELQSRPTVFSSRNRDSSLLLRSHLGKKQRLGFK